MHMNQDQFLRQQAKTREQRFLNLMEQEFHYPPKIAQAILAEVQDCLLGTPVSLKPGQMRVVLLARNAPHGRSLTQTATQEVTWTVNAGQEDREVEQQHGPAALRQVRIQRLLSEAVEQGAVATQEDLAQALQVSARTIKRDCAALQQQGVSLPTRGNLRGIGRGQTHKAQIVRRWLLGETYDQIAYQTRHSVSCIKRYIQTFVRTVQLTQKAFTTGEISLALQIGRPLVEEYLAVYQQNDTPFCRQRLAEQLDRLSELPAGQKRGQP
jgi:biotin operon repressor